MTCSASVAAPPPTSVEPIIQLALSRGVHIESDGQSLRIRGSQPAIAILRPHLVAHKAAIVDYLAKHPMPCGDPDGQSQQATSQQQTPLAILSRIAMSGQHQPTAEEIDLALWLTQVVADISSDPDPGVIWLTAKETPLIRIIDAVVGLVRGPRVDTNPPESPALWLNRIHQFRKAVESARQWRSAEYRVRDWPAELKRDPKPVVQPKLIVQTKAAPGNK